MVDFDYLYSAVWHVCVMCIINCTFQHTIALDVNLCHGHLLPLDQVEFADHASRSRTILLKLLQGVDNGCRQLEVVEGPLVDLEVRGVPALQYFGGRVWQ